MKSIYFKSLSILLSFILVVTQTLYISAKPIDLKLIQIEEKDLIPDEVSLTKAFNQLDKLDNYLAANEEITFNDLQKTNGNLLENISENAMLPGLPSDDDSALGIPSFWWGCFLGWVGILMVYIFTDNNKSETKKALNGCLVSGGAVVVVYLLIIVFYGTLIASSEYTY